jgi:hypothetical protein
MIFSFPRMANKTPLLHRNNQALNTAVNAVGNEALPTGAASFCVLLRLI